MYGVSVLVPIYNVEQYLEKCLSSLAAQTMQNMEIVCINDGSADASLQIAHAYAQKDNRFRIIDKENSGYGKSMNLGLREAKGEYIGIVESDDFVEPDMFETLYKVAKQHAVDIVKSDYWMHFKGTDKYYKAIGDYYCNKVISAEQVPAVFDCNPSIWSNLYRREFLQENDILFVESPGASFQDVAFRLKNFMCAKRAFFLPQAFYHYRRDNENASVKSTGKLFCVCDEHDDAERFMNQRTGFAEKYRFLLPYLRFGHYLWNYKDRNLSQNDRLAFLNRMYDDYCRLNKSGLLSEGYWSPVLWQMLQKLLKNKEQYFYDAFAEVQRRGMLRTLLNEFCGERNERKTAIYGAGQIGKMVLDVLHRYYFNVDCFIVTKQGIVDIVDGIPVVPVEQIVEQKENFSVIIAVAKKTQAEVLAKLTELQFPHVLLLDDTWRQVLF